MDKKRFFNAPITLLGFVTSTYTENLDKAHSLNTNKWTVQHNLFVECRILILNEIRNIYPKAFKTKLSHKHQHR